MNPLWKWLPAESLGGQIIGAPGVFSRDHQHTDVFALGVDNRIYQKRYVDGSGWIDWRDFGVLTFTSSPAVDSRAPYHLHIFARGTDGQVWTKWWTEDDDWLPWKPLGGKIIGAPAVRTSGDTTYLFARGTDNCLWWNKLRPVAPNDWNWTGWDRVDDVPFTSDPSVDSRRPGHLSVFVRGAGGQLSWKWWTADGGWLPWSDLGGQIIGAPGARTTGTDTYVFAHGLDHRLYFRRLWLNDAGQGTWDDWAQLAHPGPVTSSPVADSMGGDHVQAFFRDEHQGVSYFWGTIIPLTEIDRSYFARGGENSFLGRPTGAETATPDGRGFFRDFDGGSIYWSRASGAFEVHGAIRAEWLRRGGVRSFLGYPISDETTGAHDGRFSHFQGGSIYWKADTGAHEVHGAIRERWKELGSEVSNLGYPTTGEVRAPAGNGKWQRFENGLMYWTPERGVRDEWAPPVKHDPWAIVLCRFKDVPTDPRPGFPYRDFISESGSGGLFDYWRDVSYGALDLAGSAVFGWLDMSYSFTRDGGLPRQAWMEQARLLAGKKLAPYRKIIALINADGDDSSISPLYDVALASSIGTWGQRNWRKCRKCQGLGYAGLGPTVRRSCPQGSLHDFSGSASYSLPLNLPDYPGQHGWRRCKKCQGLAFQLPHHQGECPGGGEHDLSDGGDYALAYQRAHGGSEENWKWCRKCQGLAYAKPDGLPGPCPVGSPLNGMQPPHDHTGSFNYRLVVEEDHLDLTFCAHEMGHVYGLEHTQLGTEPPLPYNNNWCLMSSGSTWVGPFGRSGSGLCGPQIEKLGWLPNDRIYVRTADKMPNPEYSVNLVPLNRREIPGYLMVKLILLDRALTIEYRQPTGWDRGLTRSGVLIHTVKDGQFYLAPKPRRASGFDLQPGERWVLSAPSTGFSDLGVAVESIDDESAQARVVFGRGVGEGLSR